MGGRGFWKRECLQRAAGGDPEAALLHQYRRIAPRVRALIDGGMSQGTAMAFLVSGAGTSVGGLRGLDHCPLAGGCPGDRDPLAGGHGDGVWV